ncbi:hypothetical protein J6590_004807 [Homalodisca vitripennis]|nr:hypothetical protein J6590_004807 [Homalodisca vitripennis]
MSASHATRLLHDPRHAILGNDKLYSVLSLRCSSARCPSTIRYTGFSLRAAAAARFDRRDATPLQSPGPLTGATRQLLLSHGSVASLQ